MMGSSIKVCFEFKLWIFFRLTRIDVEILFYELRITQKKGYSLGSLTTKFWLFIGKLSIEYQDRHLKAMNKQSKQNIVVDESKIAQTNFINFV